MRNEDFDAFAQMLDDAYDLIGSGANKSISAGAKAMFFSALASYPLPVVRKALSAHCTDPERGSFTPKPADIIRQIELATGSDGRPGPEEAWAIALTSQDEADTVVWSAETAEAFAICRPVLDSSGPISARKTFIEAYERLVAEARSGRMVAEWRVSLGWDMGRRTAVLRKAEVAGLLPPPMVAGLLPPPEGAPANDHKARAQLATIRQMLADSAATKELRLQRAEQERLGDEMAKDIEIAQLVAQHQERKP